MAENQTINRRDQLLRKGIRFQVLYIGCIGITKSMRALEFDDRSAVTKECITKIAETAGRITAKKRKIAKTVTQSIVHKPDLTQAGSNVELTISTSSWTVNKIGVNELLFYHLMPTISFASAGDGLTADFVAYVAKNDMDRRCYVFECSAGIAQQIITVIGDAFRLRYEMFEMSQNTASIQPSDSIPRPIAGGRYVAPLQSGNTADGVDASLFGSPVSPVSTLSRPQPATRLPLSPTNPVAVPSPTSSMSTTLPSPKNISAVAHIYQNDQQLQQRLPAATPYNSFPTTLLTQPTTFDLLEKEQWFHGKLSRENSETLVRNNGEFLVRQSESNVRQFVLTGMQDYVHKHLLLIDDEGKVRTKDREFADICHLIQYHRDNSIPITSAESSLMLKTPISR